MREKHLDDIWHVMCSIKNSNEIDRVLLKNGKRSLKELQWLRKGVTSLVPSTQDHADDCYPEVSPVVPGKGKELPSLDPPLGKSGFEALLRCPILLYARVGETAYKLKVHTCHLKAILDNSRAGRYFVDTWKSKSSVRIATPAGIILEIQHQPAHLSH